MSSDSLTPHLHLSMVGEMNSLSEESLEQRRLLPKAKDKVFPRAETHTPSIDQRKLLPKKKKDPPSSTKEFGSALWSQSHVDNG